MHEGSWYVLICVNFSGENRIFEYIFGFLGEKVQGNNDPQCITFMEVGQCVHEVFFDVSLQKTTVFLVFY